MRDEADEPTKLTGTTVILQVPFAQKYRAKRVLNPSGFMRGQSNASLIESRAYSWVGSTSGTQGSLSRDGRQKHGWMSSTSEAPQK